MKYINILLFSLLLASIGDVSAQNIVFSFQIDEANSQPDEQFIDLYARSIGADEVMVGYTAVLYYDDIESTFNVGSFVPEAGLGWVTAGNMTVVEGDANNAGVPITHTKRLEIQVFDGNAGGTLFSGTPIKIGTLSYNNLDAGNPNVGSSLFLSDAAIDPGIQYVDGSFGGQNIVVEGMQSVLLPIELSDFDVVKRGLTSSYLTWETAVELGSSHFEVERSSDAYNWDFVGKVQALGNSSDFVSYDLLDSDAILAYDNATTLYYRLKMVDGNGEFEYSGIKSVDFTRDLDVNVFPNPTVDKITITADSEISDISIYNIDGKLLINQKYNDSSIDFRNMKSGMYKVIVTTETGTVTKSVVKLN